MASYLNQGGLWDNQRKFEMQHPDFVGNINIEGVVYEIVGWKTSSRNPKSPIINIKVTPRPVPMPAPKEDKDDIPF